MSRIRKVAMSMIDDARKYKRIIVPLAEALLFTGVLFLSYWIRLGDAYKDYVDQALLLAFFIVPLKIVIFWIFRLYHVSFRYTSIYEGFLVAKASIICGLAFSLVVLVLRDFPVMSGFPRSVVFIDSILTFLIGSSIRLSVRLFFFPQRKAKRGIKTLIVGAGSAGEQLVRQMQSALYPRYQPVAFVDDDPSKRGSIVHGVRVIGKSKDIPRIVETLGVEEIIIAIPSATSSQLRNIMEHVKKSGITNVKIIPRLSSLITGKVVIDEIREVTVEDLLGREPVKIDTEAIASYIKGKRVLVTGAGGSIGSELCRQIAAFGPSSLIMVDIGETELFITDRQIRKRFPEIPVPKIADVKDWVRMREIFSCYMPHVVFHAAAYKHVPLSEDNPREAILNNVEGTRVTALLSEEFGVKKFVLISTDKAVNPVSVMGATKKIAENLIGCFANTRCKFITVRFGNVLESRGSVVPIFKEQIKNREAITITHPQMERYLMSITEAVNLVLQAAAFGNGGEIFVLDMGRPVKIIELAKDIIRLSGLEPEKDVPIVITGRRQGEKLFEELMTPEEARLAVRIGKLFVIQNKKNLGEEYIKKVEHMLAFVRENANEKEITALLRTLVPEYKPESIG